MKMAGTVPTPPSLPRHGIDGFAERARRELAATGATARRCCATGLRDLRHRVTYREPNATCSERPMVSAQYRERLEMSQQQAWQSTISPRARTTNDTQALNA